MPRRDDTSNPESGTFKKRKGKAPDSNSARMGKGSLMDIASSTLERIEKGTYDIQGHTYSLAKSLEEMKKGTLFLPADCYLENWQTKTAEQASVGDEEVEEEGASKKVEIRIEEYSALVGACTLHEQLKATDSAEKRIGVLNFASAKHPGGGFLTGAQAQEESIARSSTIYPSLMTETAQQFYRSHKKDPKKGYYSHAMIYSPHVLVLRTDSGEWHAPIETDMVTSCAVNAGVVRRYLREVQSTDESNLDAAMKERMARVLYLFEKRGVRNLVLGSFGTGVFRNRVELVASVWKELLVGDEARFKDSFDKVVFAILGSETVATFRRVFEGVERSLGERGSTSA